MKKKNIQFLAIIFFSVLFLIQCTENDILERSYPTIETLQVTDVSENGVKLNATISNINQYDIIEYGFVWSLKTFPDINISEKKIISSNLTSGNFSATITTTLVNGNKYYVRSFVKTKEYLVYGNQKEFMSFGSSAALILSLEPNTGVWGDTIKIKGKNFSYVNTNNKVTFKNIAAKVIKSSDSIITTVVPEGVNSKEVTVGLEIAQRETYAATKFIIKSPTITSITPLTATFGEEITITGTNFGIKPEYNKVYFGNVLADVIASDKNSIKVLLPNNLEESTTKIKVESNAIDITHPTDFKLTQPIITFVDAGIKTDTEIIIKADFFNPVIENNKITFDGVEGEIISIDNKDIKVKVPVGPYPRRKVKVEIKIIDIKGEYVNDIDILNKWVQISNSLPFRYSLYSSNNTVVANNKAYYIAPKKDYDYSQTFQKSFLWEFDDTTLIWTKSELPFSKEYIASNESRLVSDGQNVYLYILNDDNDFWEYNTSSQHWEKKAAFIGQGKYSVQSFSINNEIYIREAEGKIDQINIVNNNLYKYSSINNSWIKLNDFYVNRRNFSATFVINDIIYFTGGVYSSGGSDCYSYDYKSDTWKKQMAYLSVGFVRNTGFSLNDYGYLSINESVYRYNPISDVWVKLTDKIDKTGRVGNFSFSLNGKGYIGGGHTYNNNTQLYDMYQLIE